MRVKKYNIVLGFLILAEIALCLYVALAGENNYLCAQGSDCNLVQNSIYGSIFGIKLAWFGVISFSILFILFLIARFDAKKYWLFFTASIIGAGFALYFISLQVFILERFCRDCLIIDSIMILTFIIVIFEFIDYKKEIRMIEKSAEKFISKAL